MFFSFKELYQNDNFINKLNDVSLDKVDLSNYKVNKYVNIKHILNKLGFKVEYGNNNVVDYSNRVMTVNKDDDEATQNFNLARDLGMFIFDVDQHKGQDFKRTSFANKFAVGFLMPKALVQETIKMEIRLHGLTPVKLQKKTVHDLIIKSTNILKVSPERLKKRALELKIFKPVESE